MRKKIHSIGWNLQRGRHMWVCSFFEKTFYQELVRLLCMGAWFESWAKHLGISFFIFQTLSKF